MTAYAREGSQAEWGSIIIEIRSVNHRHLDLSMKLPENLREFEPMMREQCQAKLSRGKVEVLVRFESGLSASDNVIVNEALAKQYIAALQQVNTLVGGDRVVRASDVVRCPQVLQVQPANISEMKFTLSQVLDAALEQLLIARANEGGKLRELILSRLQQVEVLVEEVMPVVPEMVARQKEKIMKRIEELNVNVDQERLEQELVYFAQKADVMEEIDRLKAHASEVREVLEKGGAVGRRLDFLMQELNREANTLGSKSVAVKSSHTSVDLKVLIEQMREQIQNIE